MSPRRLPMALEQILQDLRFGFRILTTSPALSATAILLVALVAGAFAMLWLMGQPFGFMAFLGIASLVGVIVSHVIVLFDFIEEAHERG